MHSVLHYQLYTHSQAFHSSLILPQHHLLTLIDDNNNKNNDNIMWGDVVDG